MGVNRAKEGEIYMYLMKFSTCLMMNSYEFAKGWLKMQIMISLSSCLDSCTDWNNLKYWNVLFFVNMRDIGSVPVLLSMSITFSLLFDVVVHCSYEFYYFIYSFPSYKIHKRLKYSACDENRSTYEYWK